MGNRAEATKRAIEESTREDKAGIPAKVELFSVMRLPQGSAADLRWFWNEAPGALGLKAMDTNGSGGGGATDPEDTHRSEAAERWHEINLLLERIGPAKTRVLQRFYQEEIRIGLESFGVLAGIALITHAAKEGFRVGARADELEKAKALGIPPSEVGPPRVLHNHFVGWLKALSDRTLPGRRVAPDDLEMKTLIQREAEVKLSEANRAYETKKALRKFERRAEIAARNAIIRIESHAHHARRARGESWATNGEG